MVYLIIAVLLGCCIWLYIRQRHTVEINISRQEENKQIDLANQDLRAKNQQLETQRKQQQVKVQELEQKAAGLREAVTAQENVLKSVTLSTENLRQAAQDQAQQAFEARVSALDAEFEKKKVAAEKKYSQAVTILTKQVLAEQTKLEDIEAKQKAFYEAQKRQQEIQEKRDYYRMVLDDDDLGDIKVLRELQSRFYRKEAIDKLVWEAYFKAPYDALMSRLFQSNTKVCGIYKITSLDSQQAYIGQSVDIKERFKQHIRGAISSAATSNKLYQEMKRQGLTNFTFEVLEEVSRDQLNEREVYWIDFYKTKEVGLNSTKGGS